MRVPRPAILIVALGCQTQAGVHKVRAMSKSVTCLAIDPGVSGAAAIVRKNPTAPYSEVLAVHDLPVIVERTSSGRIRRSVDPAKLAALVQSLEFDLLAVERLVAPPGITSIAAFSLGKTAGTIQTVAALAKRPIKLVSPNVWKRALGVPADKGGARRHATRYFGHDRHWPRASHHNRAEAALIGAWALAALGE